MVRALKSIFHKVTLVFIIAGVFISCKSTRIALDGRADKSLSARAIIKNHYRNQLDFKTLSGRVKVDYSDGDALQSVSVSLRMEKDKAIWLSAPLGVVKAFITPDRVSFYNKLQNEYFDGDFDYLSALLGSDIDFEKLQNLLLGQALLDLRKDRYLALVSGGRYELTPEASMDLFRAIFYLEPKYFRISEQKITQPAAKRLLEIRYKNYQEVDQRILPNEIGIVAIEKEDRNVIELAYRNIEFDKALSFPYEIPDGFERIAMK